ncbi:MAG: helix-turn-helix transcriptional regulator [Candidatus Electrothrix scaldis]|nr:MAG: helix-turn-helix transcriptional regulator [Candidatus Electrothrix sp. GW3-3]
MNTKDQQLFSPQATVAIDGTKIKYIRESKGLTQEYLATVVGVAIRTVSCWENNRSPNIKRENAESVAKALEVKDNTVVLDCGEKSSKIKVDDQITLKVNKKSDPVEGC